MSGISSIGAASHVQQVSPARPSPSRVSGGRILFVEDHSSGLNGMFNDGCGSASVDYDIMFNGRPTVRLDPQGNTNASATTPGTSPLTQGVVFKRRINDGFSGTFGMETWLRWTSANNNASGPGVLTTASLYNRDGTSAWLSRFWIDTSTGTDQAALSYLNSSGTYTQLASVTNQSFTQHQWDPVNSGWDRAGTWHYVKLITNMQSKQYVSIQFDDQVFSLSGTSIYQLASTGAKTMHFSVDYSQKTATRRFMNVGPVVGTVE